MSGRRVFSPLSVVKRVPLTVNSERLLLAEYTETGRKNGDEVVRGGEEADWEGKSPGEK